MEPKVTLETTAVRVWKHLSREERVAAATGFWHEPPELVVGGAIAAIVKARHLRPQVARSLPPEARAQALAGVLDPGEAVASALLVALHLGERRRMLVTFLDAVGLPHEEGVLKEDEASLPPPVTDDAAAAGVRALAQAYPRSQVETYLNTLWLQDPERWAALNKAEAWLPAQ
jgi:hypothetical protein